MRYFFGKKIWITGAASGIGRACALEFAKQDATLIISDLPEKLALLQDLEKIIKLQLNNSQVLVVTLDVTDKEQNMKAAVHIAEKIGGIDIAFFNAGIIQSIDISQFNSETIEKVMQVNYFGVVYGI